MPHKVPLCVNEIKEEILWNDRYIKIGGKTVFCKAWVSKGILRIKDILNAHDNFLSLQDLKDTFDVRCSFLITVVFLQRFLKIGKMLSHMAIRYTPTNQRWQKATLQTVGNVSTKYARLLFAEKYFSLH